MCNRYVLHLVKMPKQVCPLTESGRNGILFT